MGKTLVNGFHSKQTLTTDGSTTTFALDLLLFNETSIIVSVGNVLQGKVSIQLSRRRHKYSITAFIDSTDTAYIHFLGQAIVQNFNDGGAELILDMIMIHL